MRAARRIPMTPPIDPRIMDAIREPGVLRVGIETLAF
jgi:hypothetical protein